MKARITSSAIARAAGIHPTTASPALRGDPRLNPRQPAFVGSPHPAQGCQDMHEDADIIDATAVERVTAMIHLGARGIPAVASRTLINATWVGAAPADAAGSAAVA